MDVGRIELVMDPSITTAVLEVGPPSFGGRSEEREAEIQRETKEKMRRKKKIGDDERDKVTQAALFVLGFIGNLDFLIALYLWRNIANAIDCQMTEMPMRCEPWISFPDLRLDLCAFL